MTARPTTTARRRRVAHARLSEVEAADLVDTNLDALSLEEARALLQRVDLGGRHHPRTEQHLLLIRLLFTAATRDARRPLLRVPLQRRSAAHCLEYVQILNHWHTGEIDDGLDQQVASFILRLSDAQWRRMTLTECGYLRAWLIGKRLAARPAAQGIALLPRLHTRTRAHRDIFDHDDVWSCNRLEEWMTAHGESLVPIPQSLVQALLTSENPRARALAFELRSHPLAPDVATEAAP